MNLSCCYVSVYIVTLEKRVLSYESKDSLRLGYGPSLLLAKMAHPEPKAANQSSNVYSSYTPYIVMVI